MAIEHMVPARCTLWRFHERFGDELASETCGDLITSIQCRGQRHPALGRRLFAAAHLGIKLR